MINSYLTQINAVYSCSLLSCLFWGCLFFFRFVLFFVLVVWGFFALGCLFVLFCFLFLTHFFLKHFVVFTPRELAHCLSFTSSLYITVFWVRSLQKNSENKREYFNKRCSFSLLNVLSIYLFFN